jgi:cytochrome c oxidase subunit 2
MELRDKTPVTAEFVASKKGTFSYRCSIPCGHGHGGMEGTLIVQ